MAAREKYVLITGATDGIGLAGAEALAARGARIGIVARSAAKAAEASRRIERAGGGRPVDVFLADLASQRDVRRAASEVLARCPRVDVLVNNAGALFQARQVTEDGIERTWALNHLAPFLLTTLLLDRLAESAPSRVVTTSSHGHRMARGGIDLDDLDGLRRYGPLATLTGGPTLRYAETKLANVLFTAELGRRVAGSGVVAACFDPGLVATSFNRDNGWLARATMAAMRPFSRSPEEGARTLVWLADEAEIDGEACYFADERPQTPSAAARDVEAARRLWAVSEAQTRPPEEAACPR